MKPAAAYTLQRIQAVLGMSRGAVTRLVRAGYVTPSRGPRNEFQFTFQDVVLLRTASQLQSANVSPRRLLRSLKQLRARLPEQIPLSGLRIKAIGDQIAVRDGGAHWEPESGQLLMDFEVSEADGTVAILDAKPKTVDDLSSADMWLHRAEALEASDPGEAITSYRRALELSPNCVRAYVNLGALLCEGGHCHDALALYERALELAPQDAEVHYNGAMALEDLGLHRDAIQSYERCLALAPYLADAHYNAARLYEQLGDRQGTLRHFNAYRRLQRGDAGDGNHTEV